MPSMEMDSRGEQQQKQGHAFNPKIILASGLLLAAVLGVSIGSYYIGVGHGESDALESFAPAAGVVERRRGNPDCGWKKACPGCDKKQLKADKRAGKKVAFGALNEDGEPASSLHKGEYDGFKLVECRDPDQDGLVTCYALNQEGEGICTPDTNREDSDCPSKYTQDITGAVYAPYCLPGDQHDDGPFEYPLIGKGDSAKMPDHTTAPIKLQTADGDPAEAFYCGPFDFDCVRRYDDQYAILKEKVPYIENVIETTNENYELFNVGIELGGVDPKTGELAGGQLSKYATCKDVSNVVSGNPGDPFRCVKDMSYQTARYKYLESYQGYGPCSTRHTGDNSAFDQDLFFQGASPYKTPVVRCSDMSQQEYMNVTIRTGGNLALGENFTYETVLQKIDGRAACEQTETNGNCCQWMAHTKSTIYAGDEDAINGKVYGGTCETNPCAYINDESCSLQETGGRCVWYGSNNNNNNWFSASKQYKNPFAKWPGCYTSPCNNPDPNRARGCNALNHCAYPTGYAKTNIWGQAAETHFIDPQCQYTGVFDNTTLMEYEDGYPDGLMNLDLEEIRISMGDREADKDLILNPGLHTTELASLAKENVYKCQWCKIKNEFGMNIGCQNMGLTSRAYYAPIPSSHWDSQSFVSGENNQGGKPCLSPYCKLIPSEQRSNINRGKTKFGSGLPSETCTCQVITGDEPEGTDSEPTRVFGEAARSDFHYKVVAPGFAPDMTGAVNPDTMTQIAADAATQWTQAADCYAYPDAAWPTTYLPFSQEGKYSNKYTEQEGKGKDKIDVYAGESMDTVYEAYRGWLEDTHRSDTDEEINCEAFEFATEGGEHELEDFCPEGTRCLVRVTCGARVTEENDKGVMKQYRVEQVISLTSGVAKFEENWELTMGDIDFYAWLLTRDEVAAEAEDYDGEFVTYESFVDRLQAERIWPPYNP